MGVMAGYCAALQGFSEEYMPWTVWGTWVCAKSWGAEMYERVLPMEEARRGYQIP